MNNRKKIFAISGSTRSNSSNLRLLKRIAALTTTDFELTIFEGISELPHFNPDLDNETPPQSVADFRRQVAEADGIIICTPEYVFSLPGSLKNALEWCVSTTVFSRKPVGLITASASGEKAHEELQLVMKTIETLFNVDTLLLVKGIKGKINEEGIITHPETAAQIDTFIQAFKKLVEEKV